MRGTTPPGGLDVLLVEDNSSDRWLYEEVLRSRGHRITSCASGEEAWALFSRQVFPLILLDLGLEGAMDGLEVCRRVRTAPGGDRPVILVITGRTEPRTLEGVLREGADDYLQKPVDVSLLSVRLAVAERAVRRQQERWAAYQEREEAARQLATLLNDLGDVFFSARLEPPSLVHVSPASTSVLGRDPAELTAGEEGLRSVLPPEAIQRVRGVVEEAGEEWEALGPVVHLFTIRLPSGEARWIQASYRISRAGRGEPIRLDGTLADVSDRQRIQMELAARTREMEALARLSHEALAHREREPALLGALEVICAATGFPVAVLEGWDADSGTLSVDLVRGVEAQEDFRGLPSPEDSPSRVVLDGGAPRSFNDPADFVARIHPRLAALEPRVLLTFSLPGPGSDPLGTLSLLHTEPARPDGGLVRMATGLAAALAVHVERFRPG